MTRRPSDELTLAQKNALPPGEKGGLGGGGSLSLGGAPTKIAPDLMLPNFQPGLTEER